MLRILNYRHQIQIILPMGVLSFVLMSWGMRLPCSTVRAALCFLSALISAVAPVYSARNSCARDSCARERMYMSSMRSAEGEYYGDCLRSRSVPYENCRNDYDDDNREAAALRFAVPSELTVSRSVASVAGGVDATARACHRLIRSFPWVPGAPERIVRFLILRIRVARRLPICFVL